MNKLNKEHNYGVDFTLLSIDEGISGYRDDSLEVSSLALAPIPSSSSAAESSIIQQAFYLCLPGFSNIFVFTFIINHHCHLNA